MDARSPAAAERPREAGLARSRRRPRGGAEADGPLSAAPRPARGGRVRLLETHSRPPPLNTGNRGLDMSRNRHSTSAVGLIGAVGIRADAAMRPMRHLRHDSRIPVALPAARVKPPV